MSSKSTLLFLCHWLFGILMVMLVHVAVAKDNMLMVRSEVGVVALLNTTESSRHRRVRRAIDESVSGFSGEDQKIMLDRHNYLRSQQGASDMLYTIQDGGLINSAQEWAENCNYEHSSSDFRSKIPGYSIAGENIYAGTAPPDPAAVVQAWYDEIKFYHYDTMDCDPNEMCGHYTQVVWASSYGLGCGIKYCPDLRNIYFNGYLVVCHYGPAGNYLGQRPFTQGEACTRCPTDKKFCIQGMCSEYPMIGSKAVSITSYMFSVMVALALFSISVTRVSFSVR